MIKPVKNPCHECTHRSASCHGGCQDYALYAHYRQQIREARQRDHEVTSSLIAGAEKIHKEVYRRKRNG